jgi:pimeloyl-ACP methyl ester carboxylesterase
MHGESIHGLAVLAVAAALGVTGCSTILAVGEQTKLADATSAVGGTVATTGGTASGPLVVGLLSKDAGEFRLVDYFVAEKPGSWVIPVAAGTYWVAAFEDANANGRYDDEPGLAANEDTAIRVGPGERRSDVRVEIPRDGRLRRKDFTLDNLQPRVPAEQQSLSLFALSTAGATTTLDDPRFDRQVAASGMWKPYDFLLHSQPGIYFLEPYDPDRIPVLFIHGIGGTPTEFRTLIDSLDRRRFQAWVAYYPSGGRLDTIGPWLAQLFVRLRSTLRFEKAAVVAHSMGGLVARSFLLDDFDRSGTHSVRTFITVSSPLGGMASAGRGVEESPVVIRAWYGLAPASEFLEGLYYRNVADGKARRRLPQHMAYHLLFGYRGGGSASSDGTVVLASQLRREAQEEARSVRGFDEDHASVLRSPDVAARVNEILAATK